MPVVKVNSVELYYEETGRGPAVVFAHGGGGDSSQWRHQLAVFAQQYRVIAYDARGHGQSSAAPDYSIGACADDLAGLLRHLDIQRTYLLGATLGGITILEFALAHPDMAAALVLISTAPDTTDEMRARFDASAAVVESGDLAAFADGYVNFIFTSEYVEAHPDEVADFRQRLKRIDPAGYAGSIRALGNRADLSPRLGALSVPTLILTGERDAIPTSAPGAELLSRSLSNSRASVVPDAAHFAHIEQPETFNRLVLEFLAGVGKEAT